MNPIKLFKHQTAHNMDQVSDCVLQTILDLGLVPTQKVVETSLAEKFSSPATTHKKINHLKTLKFIEDVDHPEDKDKRKSYVRVTDAGQKYLKG